MAKLLEQVGCRGPCSYANSLFLQDLEELDPDFIMAKQVEQLEKEKKELQERLKNQEKKVTE